MLYDRQWQALPLHSLCPQGICECRRRIRSFSGWVARTPDRNRLGSTRYMTQSAVFRRDPIKVSPYDQVMDGITHGSWSYVRKDDEGMHGDVRRLAKNLIAEYELLKGGK